MTLAHLRVQGSDQLAPLPAWQRRHTLDEKGCNSWEEVLSIDCLIGLFLLLLKDTLWKRRRIDCRVPCGYRNGTSHSEQAGDRPWVERHHAVNLGSCLVQVQLLSRLGRLRKVGNEQRVAKDVALGVSELPQRAGRLDVSRLADLRPRVVDGGCIARLAQGNFALVGCENAVASDKASAAAKLGRIGLLHEVGAGAVTAEKVDQRRGQTRELIDLGKTFGDVRFRLFDACAARA